MGQCWVLGLPRMELRLGGEISRALRGSETPAPHLCITKTLIREAQPGACIPVHPVGVGRAPKHVTATPVRINAIQVCIAATAIRDTQTSACITTAVMCVTTVRY